MLRTGIGGIVCALCACTASFAAVAQEVSEHEFLADFPTVLSASRLRQNASETPQAVTVIDQAMIRASGAREFAELFRLVPGFTVSYVTYVKGLQPIVTYHGLGREFFSRLQVLIDGRSINNGTLGGVDWSEFPFTPDDIERIEVVRGPSNATHGIGAFLATINFITRHSVQQRGAEIVASGGSDGIRDAALRFGNDFGRFDYRLVAGHREDDGYDGIGDRRRRNFASARADWQFGPHDSLMLQAGGTDGANETGAGSNFDPERTASLRTGYAQARWDRSLDADNGFFVQLYYYFFRLEDSYTIVSPFAGTPLPFDGGSTAHRTDLEFQQNLGVGPDLRWVWGASAREDLTEVPSLYATVRPLHIERLFGHVEWHAGDKLLVNAGAMVENNNLTGSDLAPQLAFNYRLAPEQTLRFSVSRALRTPTVIENQGKFGVGAPGTPREGDAGDLFPETLTSREIGYVAEWPEAHAQLDLKVFDDHVRDLIDLIPGPPNTPIQVFPKNAVNGDEAVERGIEGQFTWRPTPERMLFASASVINITSADNLDRYSSSAPKRTLHLLASQRLDDDWEGSVSLHLQSGYWASGSSEPQRGFGRVDLRLARTVMLGSGEGEVALALENLFDNRYTDFRQDDAASRRFWVTVRCKWGP
jgi:iron complex outermembrane receptor protein